VGTQVPPEGAIVSPEDRRAAAAVRVFPAAATTVHRVPFLVVAITPADAVLRVQATDAAVATMGVAIAALVITGAVTADITAVASR